MIFALVIMSFLLAYLSSLIITKVLLRKLKYKHKFQWDVNKIWGKRRVPTMGGIATFTAFIFSATILILTLSPLGILNTNILLLGLLSTSLIALMGLVDDILEFTKKITKPLMAVFAAIPLMAANFSTQTIINIPFVGSVELGLIYPLLIIPLLIVFCSNAVNILAGLDGLVPGMGAMATLGLLSVSFIKYNPTAIFFFTVLFAVQIALYQYNKYPSRLLLGNIGHLFIGGAMAVGAIIGNIELALVIVMIPYAIHFFLYTRTFFKFTPHAMGDYVTKKGIIKTRLHKSYGLTIFLMKHFKNMTEKRIVYYLIGLETIFSIIAIIVYLIFTQHL